MCKEGNGLPTVMPAKAGIQQGHEGRMDGVGVVARLGRPTHAFRLSHTLNLRPYETRRLVGS
jgi:hypothetical protein